MALFQFTRKPKEEPFIKRGPFDPNEFFVTNLYDLIYFPPISSDKMDSKNLTIIGRGTYAVVAAAINMATYQLYAIPAVRKYFGAEFLHGFHASETNDCVRYDNIDDSPEAYQYTREITKVVEVIFMPFLEEKNLYIFYKGNGLSFLSADESKKVRHARINGRIIWEAD